MVDPESKDNVVTDVDDEEEDLDSGVAVQVPRSLPAPHQPSTKKRKVAMTLLISITDPGAHAVYLADANILLTNIPNLVDATSLCFALTTASFAMWMTLRM